MNPEEALNINRNGWDKVAERFYGKTALPHYGPLAKSETDLHLLGDVKGAKVLEIGCGSGHSLLYLARQGASELWGLDLSHSQIEFAFSLLKDNGVIACLFESPMEHNPGIPLDYFDLVISIYALGWTVDLPRTLEHVASYLKPDGRFVFSWEHPVHFCLEYNGGQFIVKNSYQYEGPELDESWKGVPIVLYRRKLATYINSLTEAGFAIEKLVESDVDTTLATDHNFAPEYWYSVERAKLIPTTMIIRARKARMENTHMLSSLAC
jgi:SAM-dependent methyltransferase